MRTIALKSLLILVVPLSLVRADEFDHYTNTVLGKIPEAKEARKIQKLTMDQIVESSYVLKGIPDCFLVVRTNEGRWSKFLLCPARQKLADGKSEPILLIDRFTTYREGEEKTIQTQGKNVRLFQNFHFSLDIGQVVPASVGGDLKFVFRNGETSVEPVAKAEFYLLNKALPGAKPASSAKLEIGTTFHPKYFNGNYKLFEDGRREGTLNLEIKKDGKVSGSYYSGKDGKKYQVEGKIGDPNYSIEFKIIFPQTLQTFRGFLFTGNGAAITGSARMQRRETGFYALRE